MNQSFYTKMSNHWHKTSSPTVSLDFSPTELNPRSKHKKEDEKLKTNKGNVLVIIGFIAVLGIVGHKYYGSTIAQAFKSRIIRINYSSATIKLIFLLSFVIKFFMTNSIFQ
jgi:hypothetical protein